MASQTHLVSQIHWLPYLKGTNESDLTLICSSGDHHQISLAAFVCVCKSLKKDLRHAISDSSENIFISCDISHDIVDQLCNFVGNGVIYTSDLNLRDSIKNVLQSLGFSFSLTVSDSITKIKQEICLEERKINQEEANSPEDTCDDGAYNAYNETLEIVKPEDYVDRINFPFCDLKEESKEGVLVKRKTPVKEVKRSSEKKPSKRKRKKNVETDSSSKIANKAVAKTTNKYNESVINKCKERPGLKANFDESDPERRLLSVTCEICGVVSNGWFNAQMHLSEHIGIKALECGICKRVLETKEKYKRHVYTAHREKLTCEVCGVQIGGSSALKQHMKTQHLNMEKKYKCEVCKEMFMTKGNLTLHMKKHSDERKYSCEYCGLAFKGKIDVRHHILAVHDRSKLPHKCSDCGKGFISPGMLETHKRTHTGEKPFGCEYCGKRFHNVAIMKSHVKDVHEKKFIVGCRECSMQFVKRERFIFHALTHTSLSPYKCSACNMGFRHHEAIRRHRNKEHPGMDVKFTKPSEEEKKYLLSFLVELNDPIEEIS